MRGAAIAAAAVTLLLMGATVVCIPTAPGKNLVYTYSGTRRGGPVPTADPSLWEVRPVWSADLRARTYISGSGEFDLPARRQVVWPLVIAEQALVLVLAGAAFVWLRRRARRGFPGAGGASGDSPAHGG